MKEKPVYLCDFTGDGKPGACLQPAIWRVGKHDLCDFHAGFMYSTDYRHELPKRKSLTARVK